MNQQRRLKLQSMRNSQRSLVSAESRTVSIIFFGD